MITQPAIPVWEAIKHFSNNSVMTYMHLIIDFVPSPIVVSPVTPLSIVHNAPISTLSLSLLSRLKAICRPASRFCNKASAPRTVPHE
jgi:hypothetical protein